MTRAMTWRGSNHLKDTSCDVYYDGVFSLLFSLTDGASNDKIVGIMLRACDIMSFSTVRT